ncbi:MAG: acyl carrier protein [Anaerolineae bacterium]
MREEIRRFITKDIMRDPNYNLQDDEALISGGLIDSFSLVELQLFIEEQFGVRIPDVDMTAETANSLNQIIVLIEASR